MSTLPFQTYTQVRKRWQDERAALERAYLVDLMARHGDNVSLAAAEAEVDRANLHRLLRRHGLRKPVRGRGAQAETA